MNEETFEILDGVRRAKAALICQRTTIEARIDGMGATLIVQLSQLWTTKDRIETFGVRGMDWDRILRATGQGKVLPPIEITRNGRGIPLSDVEVEEGIDAFRDSL